MSAQISRQVDCPECGRAFKTPGGRGIHFLKNHPDKRPPWHRSAQTATYTIYALIDPRDNTVRYVGKTYQPVKTRLAGHGGHVSAACGWIKALRVLGLQPQIVTLESFEGARPTHPRSGTPEGARLAELEYQWINHYREQGASLLNRQWPRPSHETSVASNAEQSVNRRMTGCMGVAHSCAQT